MDRCLPWESKASVWSSSSLDCFNLHLSALAGLVWQLAWISAGMYPSKRAGERELRNSGSAWFSALRYGWVLVVSWLMYLIQYVPASAAFWLPHFEMGHLEELSKQTTASSGSFAKSMREDSFTFLHQASQQRRRPHKNEIQNHVYC